MRAETLAGAVVVVAFGLLVVVLLVLSLPWPLIQDAPVMHYIAWRIGEGDVPYRDLYDIARCGDVGAAARSIGAYVAGSVAVPAALATWLALAGGLRAWVDVVFGYAIPVYGHLGRSAPWLGHRWLGWIPLGLAAVGPSSSQW